MSKSCDKTFSLICLTCLIMFWRYPVQTSWWVAILIVIFCILPDKWNYRTLKQPKKPCCGVHIRQEGNIMVVNRGVVHSWESVRYHAEGFKALAWERQCHRWTPLGTRQHSNVHMNDVIYFHYSWNQNGNKKKLLRPNIIQSLQQGDKYKQTSKKKRILNRQPAASAHHNRMLAASANLQVL